MRVGRAQARRGVAARLPAWAGATVVPLVLLPLAGVFIWVAIWKVWLPHPGGGSAVTRAVTTVDANAGTRPTHKVTTVVKTAAAQVPSRRSETLALALLFLGAGIAVVGVFNDRIGSLELDKGGLKVTLTQPEKAGAAELVDRLARRGAGSLTLARGLRRYLRTVAAQRPPAEPRTLARTDTPPESKGLSAEQAHALAWRIADDLA